MTHVDTKIQQYIEPGRRVHLCGIGGVSMSPLAEVLHKMGLTVQGSDMSDSAAVRHLRELGIPVTAGHSAEAVAGAEFVIRTAAVRDSNPEIAAAREQGIPVFERAEAWGAIMQQYENAVCIAGTHGKTTTTSMTTHIFMAARTDPTVMLGGTLPMLHSGYRVGRGDTIILESCEYRNSFLYFFPTVAVILNVEEDHLDFFKDLDDIKASFRRFAELVPEGGHIVASADDPGAMDALKGLPLFTFGCSEGADCQAKNLTWEHGRPSFDIVIQGEVYAHLSLRVAGRHNLLNALAAASAAYVLGIPSKAVKLGLEGFFGAGRRFEQKGSYNGAQIFDDYAHHPAELHALLEMTRSLGYKRVICAFQPHTYTRTKALFHDFIRELRTADLAVLTDIYAARETNTVGISSMDLAREIPGCLYCPTLEEAAETLMKTARPGDLILTVGAGDIYLVGEDMVRRARESAPVQP
ncbi:MAG: UDP-N-acetylmuramate--L-alanine ligase [Oscillospiraceae bacterium]|nr:UDP-N-acetylmuramate--L-alanine ligase [Oscillospiraceae bacterium]